jgi:hypothetical protein
MKINRRGENGMICLCPKCGDENIEPFTLTLEIVYCKECGKPFLCNAIGSFED